jgi:FkbM family methyltransferase
MMALMPTPLSTRARVQARLILSRSLMVMPMGTASAIRDAYIESTGTRRKILGGAVRVLRHRPLTPLEQFSLPDNPAVHLAAVRSRLAQLLYWYGERGYEGAETDYWRQLCAHSSSILEVGANIGYYTVQGALAAPEAAYVAVEPHPDSAATARRNVALNSLTNVTVIQAAVVGEGAPDTMELALPDVERYAAPTGAYLSEGTEGIKDRAAARTVTVPTTPMKDLIGGVDLLKLDIEGYEAVVLEAVWDQILDTRPTIVVEVLKDVPKLRRLICDLRSKDYRVLAIGTDRLHVISDEELADSAPLPRYGSRDVILVPAERSTDLTVG